MRVLLVGQKSQVNTFIEENIKRFDDKVRLKQVNEFNRLERKEFVEDAVDSDLVILDFSTYSSSRILDTVEQLKQKVNNTAILVVHHYMQPSLVEPLWNRGIDGYVPIDRLYNELYPALKTILVGDRYINKELLNN